MSDVRFLQAATRIDRYDQIKKKNKITETPDIRTFVINWPPYRMFCVTEPVKSFPLYRTVMFIYFSHSMILDLTVNKVNCAHSSHSEYLKYIFILVSYVPLKMSLQTFRTYIKFSTALKNNRFSKAITLTWIPQSV